MVDALLDLPICHGIGVRSQRSVVERRDGTVRGVFPLSVGKHIELPLSERQSYRRNVFSGRSYHIRVRTLHFRSGGRFVGINRVFVCQKGWTVQPSDVQRVCFQSDLRVISRETRRRLARQHIGESQGGSRDTTIVVPAPAVGGLFWDMYTAPSGCGWFYIGQPFGTCFRPSSAAVGTDHA